MMGKDSFILYDNYAEQISFLTDEQAGVLFKAIYAYRKGAPLPEMDAAVNMAFSFIRGQLSRDEERYNDICEKRRAAGAMGGATKGNKNAIKQPKQANASKRNQNNQMQAKQADNEFDNEFDNDNEFDSDISPTLQAYVYGGNGAKMAAFLRKYPLINPDSHVAGYGLDFDALTVAFERSKKYLIGKPHDLSWVAKNYHRIIGGAFDDKWDDDGELTAEEMEANRIAFEAKYGKTAGD